MSGASHITGLIAIDEGAPLWKAVEIFQLDPDLRVLPVVRDAIAEVGAGQNDMAGAITGVDQLTASIVTAVTEQAGATRSIDHNVTEARSATTHIQVSAEGINLSTDVAAASADDISSLATALSGRAFISSQKVMGFLDTVRAA
jgi:hypothetical protein